MTRKFFGTTPFFYSLCFLAIIHFVFLSCKKQPSIDQPQPAEVLQTAQGTPVGNNTSAMIGEAGGTLQSYDGQLTISIPAGALSSSTKITIQPISNPLPVGVGNGYRLTPHGNLFKKAATLSFKYDHHQISNTSAPLLCVAFQNEDGSWEPATNERVIDTVRHVISISTTHFSDWTVFEAISLTPATATVSQGASIDLQVQTVMDISLDAQNPLFLFLPGKKLKKPALLNRGIRSWSVAPLGTIASKEMGRATFTAPEDKQGITAVNCELDAAALQIGEQKFKKIELVSNITVTGNSDIVYMKVDENWTNPQYQNQCALYLYGSFGMDPGADKRSVRVGGQNATVTLWSPGFIICLISRTVFGEVSITSSNFKAPIKGILNRYYGTFTYTRYQGGLANSNNANALKEQTKFTLVYRGFGKPLTTSVDDPFPFEQLLNWNTIADYSLGGSATITQPDNCLTTNSISLAAISGTTALTYFPDNKEKFMVTCKEVDGGIVVRIAFLKNDLGTGTIHYSSRCNTPADIPVSLSVGFAGFENTDIPLSFVGDTGLKLSAGTIMTSTDRIGSSILTNAWASSQYQTDGLMKPTLRTP